ncbi:MAG: hypothetical protein KQI35_10415 [Bacteroidetes bacterium]|nr:hypothetical protein [Bacteroidota bacterium]
MALKQTFIVFLLTIIVTLLQAQSDKVKYANGGIDPDILTENIFRKKLDVNVELGTYFSTSSGYGSGFGTYIAPELSYALTPKFRLTAGLRVFQTSTINEGTSSTLLYPFPYHGNAFGSLIYVKGNYLLTENLMVSGTAFKQVDPFRMNHQGVPGPSLDYQGIIMGLDYKIGENFFIHGEVEFSNGAGYRGMSPLNSGFNHSNPFMRNPFMR